jgi:hypothetical protein
MAGRTSGCSNTGEGREHLGADPPDEIDTEGVGQTMLGMTVQRDHLSEDLL